MKKSLLPLLFLALCAGACGDDDPKPEPQDDADAGTPDAGTGPDCYENPTTHVEIINACTDAEKIEKTPTLPLLTDDGEPPPLP